MLISEIKIGDKFGLLEIVFPFDHNNFSEIETLLSFRCFCGKNIKGTLDYAKKSLHCGCKTHSQRFARHHNIFFDPIQDPHKKICVHCKEIKLLEEFPKLLTNSDGYGNTCLKCLYGENKNLITKTCNKCRINKKLCDFPIEKRYLSYLSICSICVLANNRKYVNEHRDHLNSCHRKRAAQNRNKIREYSRTYWKKNNEKTLEKRRKYRITHRDEIRKQNREIKKRRLAKDPQYKLTLNLGTQLRGYLKRSNIRKTDSTISLLDCSYQFFTQYIQSQFSMGMDWKNEPKDGFKKWQLDHLIPVQVFDLTDPLQRKLCFNWSNFAPCWGADNIKKMDYLYDGRRARELTKEEKLVFIQTCFDESGKLKDEIKEKIKQKFYRPQSSSN